MSGVDCLRRTLLSGFDQSPEKKIPRTGPDRTGSRSGHPLSFTRLARELLVLAGPISDGPPEIFISRSSSVELRVEGGERAIPCRLHPSPHLASQPANQIITFTRPALAKFSQLLFMLVLTICRSHNVVLIIVRASRCPLMWQLPGRRACHSEPDPWRFFLPSQKQRHALSLLLKHLVSRNADHLHRPHTHTYPHQRILMFEKDAPSLSVSQKSFD